MNSKVFGMLLIASIAAVASVLISTQNAVASNIITNGAADVDTEEAVLAKNTSMAAGVNETMDGNTTDVQFLSIQTAQSGSFSQVNDTAYTLELNNVSDSTIMFSDRPERIVETVSTADFVGNWTVGQNSFAADAPNTALIVEDIQTVELDTSIIELFNPMYGMNTNTLTYTIVAENGTSIELPNEFGRSTLVIDVTPDSETSLDCEGCLP